MNRMEKEQSTTMDRLCNTTEGDDRKIKKGRNMLGW